MKRARFYENKGLDCRCLLCPHRCLIPLGQAGRCGARRNFGGVLYAESYGQLTSLAMDPIEKKPLHRFFPGTSILSAGSFGCNMTCSFCQNHGISQNHPPTRYVTPRDLTRTAEEQPDNMGLAFTYNEPLISMEYLLDTAPLLRGAGLKTVLVTNGMVTPDILCALLPSIDAMNIDVKSFSEDFYRRHGGHLETVKTNVRMAASVCHVEVTTLIIPGENDREKELMGMAEWLADISPNIPWHLSRFFPRYRMADRPPTSRETLFRLRNLAARIMNDVIIGNL